MIWTILFCAASFAVGTFAGFFYCLYVVDHDDEEPKPQDI